jgi:hypothetical protein
MKKIGAFLLAVCCLATAFTSCKEDGTLDENVVVTGYWQCTSISGNAGGFDLSEQIGANSEYLRVFSIGLVGASKGKYARISPNESAITEMVSGTKAEEDSQAKQKITDYCQAGDYVIEGNQITFNNKNGGSDVFSYTLSSDANVLTLTQEVAKYDNEKVNTALSILNMFTGKQMSTTVGVVYNYKRITSEDFQKLFNKNQASEEVSTETPQE